jgi:hypothetical protein
MIGAEMAAPIRAAACVVPCKKPRIEGGYHDARARVATGKLPDSPSPNSKRMIMKDMKDVATPVNAVNIDHHAMSSGSTRRGPIRSPNAPTKTGSNEYVTEKAEKIKPISVAVK